MRRIVRMRRIRNCMMQFAIAFKHVVR